MKNPNFLRAKGAALFPNTKNALAMAFRPLAEASFVFILPFCTKVS